MPDDRTMRDRLIQAMRVNVFHAIPREEAEAAIDAILDELRQPDPAMASAGMHALSELPEDAGWPTLAREACRTFKAMIDTAKQERG